MGQGIQGVSQWNTWRIVNIEDSDVSGAGTIDDYRPGEVWDSASRAFNSTHRDKMISVHPFTGIAVAFYGLGAENDTGTITIAGWMFPDSDSGPGPGQEIWKGTIIASATQWAADIPLRDGKWTSQTWRTVDQFTEIHDPSAGQVLLMEDASAVTAVLLVQTMGYSHLSLVIDDLDGLNEMTQLGAIWKGVSKEGVL